jgi:UPF0755 protein
MSGVRKGTAGIIARLILGLAGLSALAVAAGALALGAAMRPVGQGERSLLFAVARGESASEVALSLETKRLIRSALAFKLLARLEGSGSALKAGVYRVTTSMSAGAILAELVSGKQSLAKLTVPEGYTLGQLASLVDRLGIAPKEGFLAAARSGTLLEELDIPASSAEGYLFPDTYYVPAGFTAEALIRLMVKAFRDKLAEAIPEAAALPARALHDKVVLASIVEREYKAPNEAAMIASVFYNRIKIKMALQSCATIVYIITERQGKPHPEVVLDRDLKIDDPYNTYTHRDLPPGPISNPGITALTAALRPATSKYLYFRLVDGVQGTHHFSSSLEEHIDARSLYIKKVGG